MRNVSLIRRELWRITALLLFTFLMQSAFSDGFWESTPAPAPAPAPTPNYFDCGIVDESSISIPPQREVSRGVNSNAISEPAGSAGLASFLEDRFSQMAVDLAETRILDSMCDPSNQLSKYFTNTCNANKVYQNLNSQIGGTSLGWLPSTLLNDLKIVPACLYKNRHYEVAYPGAGFELYVLGKAISDIHNGIASPMVELARIQNASYKVILKTDKGKVYWVNPAPLAGKATSICRDDQPCWLFDLSVMANSLLQASTANPANDAGTVCSKFVSAINDDVFIKTNSHLSCPTQVPAEYYQLELLLTSLNSGVVKLKSATSDQEKLTAEKEILTSVVGFVRTTQAIIGNGITDNTKLDEFHKWVAQFEGWLPLWLDARTNNYAQFGLDLMSGLGCRLSSSSSDSANIDPSDATVCQAISIAASLSQAKSGAEVKNLLVADALPSNAWALRSHKFMFDIGALVGGRYEVVHTESNNVATITNGVGVFAPVGFDLTWPGKGIALGLMVPLIDVGDLISYQVQSQQSTSTVQPSTSMNSIISPGLIVRVQAAASPVVWFGGVEYSNSVRVTTLPSGAQQELSGFRAVFGVSLDMPLFLLH